jgi:hypothetical protein
VHTQQGGSRYWAGTVLASDDYLQNMTGFAQLVLVYAGLNPQRSGGRDKYGDGIVADSNSGAHYRYRFVRNQFRTPMGGRRSGWVVPLLPPPNFSRSTVDDIDRRSHPFAGIAPYFKFRASENRVSEYNQPSTWFFLNKNPRHFQTEGSRQRPWFFRFSWNDGVRTVSLDTTIGGPRASFLFDGLTVISRGMAYYHRPGALGQSGWGEHPNFFNPFWRARLAPVGQALIDFWTDFAGGAIAPTPESGAIEAMVRNLINNFLSDLFLRTVTAVMTH